MDDVCRWHIDERLGDGDGLDQRNRIPIPCCGDQRERHRFLLIGVVERDAVQFAWGTDGSIGK